MTTVVLIDSGPLGKITHPKIDPNVKEWLQFIQANKIALRVAEISDYELRRNLLLEGLTKSINRLEQYRQTERIIPITSKMMLKAAELWAWVRSQGQPTASNESLDADVILVAQAILQKEYFDEVIIVTENPKHICRFDSFGISTWEWKQALADCKSNSITLYNQQP
jgi:predicted nucleic acid-binding protein